MPDVGAADVTGAQDIPWPVLKATIESVPVAMVLSDDAGVIRWVNRETETLLAYARSELLGRPVEMLIPAALRPGHAQLRGDFYRTPTVRRMGTGCELFALKKDGELVPIEIALTPVVSDDITYVMSVILDLSHRRRLEAALVRANEELEQRVHERTLALEAANQQAQLLLADLRAQRAELERLSREDALTHLANRRDFDERLEAELARARRHGSSLSVAMLDLDRFKLVNDRFGHAVGDAVLRAVADLIRQQCRTIDFVARYGGEEFALVLPDADLPSAVVLCERIRVAFENHDWDQLQPGLAVRVSAGVSSWNPRIDSLQMLAAADRNLYQAKAQGRNRVIPPPS